MYPALQALSAFLFQLFLFSRFSSNGCICVPCETRNCRIFSPSMVRRHWPVDICAFRPSVSTGFVFIVLLAATLIFFPLILLFVSRSRLMNWKKVWRWYQRSGDAFYFSRLVHQRTNLLFVFSSVVLTTGRTRGRTGERFDGTGGDTSGNMGELCFV